jgi:hypothetical protein
MNKLTRPQVWAVKAGLMIIWPVVVVVATVVMATAWFLIPFMDASVTARLRKD